MTATIIPITAKLGAWTLVAMLTPFPVATHQAESVERVTTLHSPRSVHTATALGSGQVLIAGGMAAGPAHPLRTPHQLPDAEDVRTSKGESCKENLT